MRVALVSAVTSFHVESDGNERLRRLAELLADRGHEVVVLSAKWWEGDMREFQTGAITYRAVAEDLDDSLLPFRVLAAVRRMEADVVHVVCQPPLHMVAARIGSLLSRKPYVVECYDPPRTTSSILGRLYSVGARGADAVITPSRTVKTRVREFGVRAERVHVIPSGIDMETIRSIEPTENSDIVYSRHLDDEANLETLLLALAEFREYDWDATVVGDGPRREDYERQAADLRIDDRVHFVGARDVEERIALFKNAHVYVHTAEYTPFAIELLRAMASGCVGIVEYHADSSAHELVEQEDRGFTATSAQELTERLAAAGDLDTLDVDERFAAFDERHFLERYLDVYRAVQS